MDLAMITAGTPSEQSSYDSDLNELKNAAKKVAKHAMRLGGLGFTIVLKWIAFISAIYLLILDWTNWRTNLLTSLLVPYIFLSAPSSLFSLLRGEVGEWIGLITVFYASSFLAISQAHTFVTLIPIIMAMYAEWLEIPGALILLLVVAPSLFAHKLRSSCVGVVICSAIGCYLLQEHI